MQAVRVIDEIRLHEISLMPSGEWALGYEVLRDHYEVPRAIRRQEKRRVLLRVLGRRRAGKGRQ